MDKDVEIEQNGEEDMQLYIDQKGILKFLLQKWADLLCFRLFSVSMLKYLFFFPLVLF